MFIVYNYAGGPGRNGKRKDGDVLRRKKKKEHRGWLEVLVKGKREKRKQEKQ